MNAVDRNIRLTKKQNRNIFRKYNFGRNFWIDVIYAVIPSSLFVGFVADLLQIGEAFAMLAATLLLLVPRRVKEYHRLPEPFRSNNLFVGLCSEPGIMEENGKDIHNSVDQCRQNQSKEMDGLISRDVEVTHLMDLIGAAFASGKAKTAAKKGICLAGTSGCGKTVLINMLVNELKEQKSPEYDVIVFDDIYNYNVEDDNDCRKKWDNRIKNIVLEKRTLAVFDQFEKVLQLDDEGKSFVFRRISRLAVMRNVIILFSIREEYLLLFLESFSMDLMEESREDSIRSEVFLENLVNYVNYKGGNHDFATDNITGRGEEKKEKKPGSKHGNNIGEKEAKGKKTVGKGHKTDSIPTPQIIMLESRHNLIPNEIVRDDMVRKCARLCGGNYEEGKLVYAIVKDKPLIEQQMILNMKSQDEKLPGSFEKAFRNGDFASLMSDYYNVQLCSTGHYLTACQIMYILSKARMDNIEVYGIKLEDAVCIVGESEREEFKKCLEALIDLHLVKGEESSSVDRFYEVSHDFISKSFSEYAIMTLTSELRGALDDAYAISVAGNRKKELGTMDARKSYEKTINSDGWVTVIWIASLVIVALRFIIQRVAISHGGIAVFLADVIGSDISMNKAVQVIDSCICSWGTLSIPVMVMSITSLFYIYNFYRNITQFYGITSGSENTGKTAIPIRKYLTILLYFVSMFCGMAAAFTQEFWLLCLGFGNMFNGLACVLVAYDKRMSINGRSVFLPYGWKTMLCSVLLIFGSIAASMMDTSAGIGNSMKEFVQLFCMAVLLLFSYRMHLEKEYIYVRLQALLHMKKRTI